MGTQVEIKQSQDDMVLGYLRNGGKLTPMDAMEKFRCFRLASVIHRLRKKGHAINKTMISRNGKSFAQYGYAWGPNERVL